MNERKALKARLELLEAGLSSGRTTQAEVDYCREAYEKLRNSSVVVASAQKQFFAAPTSSVTTKVYGESKVEQLSEQAKELLKQLRAEQNVIESQKNNLSNSLQNYPKNLNCKPIVEQILSLRERWKDIGDKIRYVIENGKLPEDKISELPDGWADKLPRSKYELDREIKNLKINIKKWADKKKQAKTLTKQQEYETKIREGQIKLDVMTKLFMTL